MNTIFNEMKDFFFSWLGYSNSTRIMTGSTKKISQAVIESTNQQNIGINNDTTQQSTLKNVNTGAYWASILIYALRFIKNSAEYTYKAFAHDKKRKEEVDALLKKQYRLQLLEIANAPKNREHYQHLTEEEKLNTAFNWLMSAQSADLTESQTECMNQIAYTGELLLIQKVEQLNNEYLPLMRNDFIWFALNVITGGFTLILLQNTFSLATNLSATAVAQGFSLFAGASLLVDGVLAGYNYFKACEDYRHDKQIVRDKYVAARRTELAAQEEKTSTITFKDITGAQENSYHFEKQLLKNKKTDKRHAMYASIAIAVIAATVSIMAVLFPPLAPVFAGVTLCAMLLNNARTAYAEYASQKRDLITMAAFNLEDLCPLGQDAYHHNFAPYKTDDLNAQFLQQQEKLTTQKVALILTSSALFIIAAVIATAIIAVVGAAPFVLPLVMLGIAVSIGLFSSISNKLMINSHEHRLNELAAINNNTHAPSAVARPVVAQSVDAEPVIAEPLIAKPVAAKPVQVGNNIHSIFAHHCTNSVIPQVPLPRLR